MGRFLDLPAAPIRWGFFFLKHAAVEMATDGIMRLPGWPQELWLPSSARKKSSQSKGTTSRGIPNRRFCTWSDSPSQKNDCRDTKRRLSNSHQKTIDRKSRIEANKTNCLFRMPLFLCVRQNGHEWQNAKSISLRVFLESIVGFIGSGVPDILQSSRGSR